MTHVAQRSSGASSSVAPTEPQVFDLASEHETLLLLKTIHRGGLAQRVRNNLRDHIFSLRADDANGVTATLAALSEAGFTVKYGSITAPTKTVSVPSATTATPAPAVAPLGRVRATPQFTPHTTSGASAVAVTPDTTAPVESPDSVAVPTPAATEPAIPATEVPAPETPAVSEPEPVVTPVAAEPAAPAASEPSTSAAPGDAMDRIKEIKRQVNEKIGNPITLIDADNAVGREYMNALLAAMKMANGGSPDALATAMARLEKAFTAALAVMEQRPAPETVTDKFVEATTPAKPVEQTSPRPSGFAAAAASEPTPSEAMAESTTAAAAAPAEEAELAVPASVEPVGFKLSVTSADDPDTASTKTPIMSSVADALSDQLASSASVDNHTESAMSATPIAPPPVDVSATPSAAPSAAVPPVSSAPADVSTDSDQPHAPARLMSVAKEEQIQKLMRQKQAEEAQQKSGAAAQVPESGDPLQAPAVTAGLKQLLSEWSLFKSSGFFGTGPGGIDHPLYKQLATLTMAAVVAGRFEGATPQIKQSITDYMNGWRYEEGISHDHNETFEHYLRRVIQHILAKQKR